MNHRNSGRVLTCEDAKTHLWLQFSLQVTSFLSSNPSSYQELLASDVYLLKRDCDKMLKPINCTFRNMRRNGRKALLIWAFNLGWRPLYLSFFLGEVHGWGTVDSSVCLHLSVYLWLGHYNNLIHSNSSIICFLWAPCHDLRNHTFSVLCFREAFFR